LIQFVAADFKVARDVTEDPGQSSHFDRIMVGNRDVMLATVVCGQPQMAAVWRVIW
jgi:hypothetical protein